MKGRCDVCWLLRKDKSEKDVQFCSLCQANLCDDCRPKFHLRAVAAIKQALGGKDA